MYKSTVIVLLLVMAATAGCQSFSITGSGNVVTQEVAIADFDSLIVSDGFEVEVLQGDTFGVVIRVDEELVENLQVVKEENALKIGLEPGVTDLKNATLEPDVTMPELIGLDQSEGSHVDLSGLSSGRALAATLSGGSHLNGSIDAGDASFDLSGGSHATLKGSAGDLTLLAGGGSHANLGDLAVLNANVEARGGSHATVNPSGTLDAVAASGSHVKYAGEPTLGTIDSDVSSSFKQK